MEIVFQKTEDCISVEHGPRVEEEHELFTDEGGWKPWFEEMENVGCVSRRMLGRCVFMIVFTRG